MPILSADAPELQRLRSKSWEVTRMLPDVRVMSSQAFGQFSPAWYGAEFAYKNSQVYQEASQMGLGAVLQNVGIPVLSVFKDIASELNIDVVDQVTQALVAAYNHIDSAITSMKDAGDSLDGGAAMDTSVSAGIGFAVEGFSMVPIAGWIGKLAWGVAKFVRGIVDLVKSDKYGEVNVRYPDTVFNPTTDNSVLNSVIGSLRFTRDWSRRFGPPALGNGQGTLPDYWMRDTEGGNKEITRVLGRNDEGQIIDWQAFGWTGMVPGATKLVRGVQVRGNGAYIMGPNLLPSAQQILFWLWSSVIGKKGNAGPAMYCVDTDALRTWSSYIGGLHEFIYDTGGLNDTQKSNIMAKFNKDESGKPIFGWGTKIKPTSNEHDNYHPVKMADVLEKRQFDFLDTLLVAYVDEEYAAIAESSSLRDKWKQRRKDLLEHPARCDVDLASVSDSDYRQELKARGAGAGVCMVASQSFAAAPVEGFGGGNPPDGNPFDKAPKRTGGGGKGIGFLPILALGVGAYYAYKKGYHKRLPLLR